MKRFKQLFMLIALMCATTSAWADSNFSGSGTENSPFLIQSNADLLKFRDVMSSTNTYGPYYQAYFKLTTDLTFTGTNNFTPIGGGNSGGNPFRGVFDGDGYVISGLNATTNINSYTGAGLFYCLWGATIKNLTVQECSFSMNTYSGSPVGAIAGEIDYWDSKPSKIINCHVIDCTLSSSSTNYDESYTGGIVGKIDKTSCYVQDCTVEGTTTCTAEKYCGAIVGKPITSSYTLVTNNRYQHTVQVTDSYTNTTYTTSDIGVGGATRPYDLLGQAEPVGPVVTFVYSGKTVFTIRALEVGGTVTVPSVEEMESTYSIQNATFTYNNAPFTSSTPVNENIDVTIGGTLIVSSIAIAASSVTPNPADNCQVTVTPVPSFASYTLESSNPWVATVAEDGVLTFVGPGTTTITATANDDPTKTASIDITYPTNGVAVIGDNATSSSNTCAYYHSNYHSTTQQIYTKDEVGPAGTITALAFKVAATTSSDYSTYVRIYLGHKSGTFASASDYVPSSKLTEVYAGYINNLGRNTGWEKVTFNKNDGKFDYNGSDNLVVVVSKTWNVYNGSQKYYYESKSGYVLYRAGSTQSSVYPATATGSYYTTSYRPSVKFWVEYPYPPTNFEIEEGVEYTRTQNVENVDVTYTRSFDTDRVGKYQAWFVPFNYVVTADDLTKFDFFKINMIANAEQPGENPASDDVYIFLNPVAAGTTLYGNKPYVCRPKEVVDNYEFVTNNATLLAKTDASVLQTSTTTATYDFYGTYANTEATTADPFYYVSKNGNICKGTAVTVGPYRWILKATSKGGGNYSPKFSFTEGETTGIHSIENGQLTIDNGVYNLNGQRVKQPTKGLYIVNGHKVVIK